MNILAHDGVPQYQVWLQKVEWFRKHLLDNPGHADKHIDTVIPVYSHNFIMEDICGERTVIPNIHKDWKMFT